MQLSELFASFVYSLRYDDLPCAVREEAKFRILDNLGAAVAGCVCWPYREAMLDACSQLGLGSVPVIGGSKYSFSPAVASMINAAFAQANELDDGHKYAGVHAGCCVVSSAIVVGAQQHKTAEEVITAVTAGYEIVYRLAVGMSPHLINKGFHPSSVLDSCGVAAATGKLLGLTERQMSNALGMSALFGGGFMEATVSGQQSKGVVTGRNAFTGMLAALLAQRGMEGALTSFDGPKGMFFATSQDVDVAAIGDDLGRRYSIADTYTKLYPICRHAQAAVEAILELQKRHGFTWRQVQKIQVHSYQVCIDMTGRIYAPKDTGEAKFSLAYAVAAALISGGVTAKVLDAQYYTDPAYLALAQRVEVSVDEELQALYPQRRGAKVHVRLADGTLYHGACYDPKGSPENPLDWDGLSEKFVSNCSALLGADEAMSFCRRLAVFEQETDISGLYGVLC